MFKSWKTMSAGIAAILLGIGNLDFSAIFTNPDQLGVILAGIGLLFSRDNNVTSEDAHAKTSPERKEEIRKGID